MKYLKSLFEIKQIFLRAICTAVVGMIAFSVVYAQERKLMLNRDDLLCVLERSDVYLGRDISDPILVFSEFCPDNVPDVEALAEMSTASGPEFDFGSDDLPQKFFTLSRAEFSCLSKREGLDLVRSQQNTLDLLEILDRACGI